MGYSCEINAYDENMKFIGFVIEDYSLAWFREFNSFINKNGKANKELDIFGKKCYDSQVAKDFLYYCEKNGLCKDKMYQTSIQIAKKIKNNKKIHYINVSCC